MNQSLLKRYWFTLMNRSSKICIIKHMQKPKPCMPQASSFAKKNLRSGFPHPIVELDNATRTLKQYFVRRVLNCDRRNCGSHPNIFIFFVFIPSLFRFFRYLTSHSVSVSARLFQTGTSGNKTCIQDSVMSDFF